MEKMFSTEVTALGRLSHPNVVRLVGHATDSAGGRGMLIYEQLAEHNTRDDLWVAVAGSVYDFSGEMAKLLHHWPVLLGPAQLLREVPH